MNGAGAVAAALRDAGIDLAFGLPGVHNLPLWPAGVEAGVRIVGSRHEQGCAYAADGFARATGGPGVALVTTGPGAANTLAAVGEAWASHSPVVVLATDIASTVRRPGAYRGALHECTDQAALFAPVTKTQVTVGAPADLGAAVHEALAMARTAPAGPVYVGVPTDFLTAPAPRAALPAAAWQQTRADVNAALDLIRSSERPLLWIGGGTRQAGDAIDTLARRLGAPVLATFQARGVLPASHPLLVPAPPHEPLVTDLVRRADLAIVVGSDLDAMNTMAWRLPLPERRLAIDVDPCRAGANYPMAAAVAADARLAGALAGELAARAPWAGDLAALGRAVRADLRADPTTAASVEFLERTEAALPPDAVVFADMCIPGYWLAGYAAVESPRGLHYPMGWGTLGWAFPAAAGAAAGLAGTRPVVAVAGDGGLLLALGELATVAQEDLPLTVVVVDDGGYGMLRYGHESEPNGADLRAPDFAAVAAAFGIPSVRVDGTGAAYGDALAGAVASGGPRVLHVRARLHPPRTTSPRWPLRG